MSLYPARETVFINIVAQGIKFFMSHYSSMYCEYMHWEFVSLAA